MELLRRLRVVWCVACVLGAATALFAYTNNPHPSILLMALGSAVAGCAFYVPGSWRAKLSVLWFGGVGPLFVGSAASYHDNALFQYALIFIPTVWVVIAACTWVVSGLLPSKNRTTGV